MTNRALFAFIFATALISTLNADNFFYVNRIQSSCMTTIINLSANSSADTNCYTLNWSEFANSTTYYTKYTDMADGVAYYAQIGALTVQGYIDSYNLSFYCPPDGYNGLPSGGCSVSNAFTQLVVLKISVNDNMLHGYDVILSGTPFPPVSTLMNNAPPFGLARHTFSPAIAIQTSGYFQVCKNQTSSLCPNTASTIALHTLPNPLPSNTNYGYFGLQSANLYWNTTWIMDDPNQLLILDAVTQHWYFNRTGYFFYDSSKNSCQWISTCTYHCEAYNYNSRFLDYAGEWNITNKWGIGSANYSDLATPVLVYAYIGNAIDAAGIFPVIAYIEKTTGAYMGMEKVDTVGSTTMGSFYWYTRVGDTVSAGMASIKSYSPNVVDVGCAQTFSEWSGNSAIGGQMFKISHIFYLYLSSIFISGLILN